MAIPVIYKGDDTDFNGSSLSVNLETDFDLDGCEVTLTLSGCKRSFTGLTGRAATLSLAFSAEETAGMPVGTHRATVSVYDSSGRKRTASDDIRIRVTDDLREAYGGADDQEIDVTIETGFDPTRIMEGETLKTNTPNSMRQAIKKIAQALGATVSALAVSVLPVLGASVQTAPLGDLDLDQNPSVVTNVTLDGLASSSNTYTKAETDAKIVELAPAPGNYNVVSNAAMHAVQNKQGRIRIENNPRISWDAYDVQYLHLATGRRGWEFVYDDFGTLFLPMRFGEHTVATVSDIAAAIAEIDIPNVPAWAKSATKPEYTAEEVGATTPEDVTAAATAATNYTDWVIQNMDLPIPVFDVYAEDVTNVADFVTSNAISTNNAAFVEAVRSTPLTGASASDLAEIGEYGSYGTVGAAILALIAGLAALKRGKADKTELPYDIVAVTPANGVVTVEPRTIAIYTAGDSAAAFTVAVGTGETGKARDCELVIDCTATGAVAPTVTWPATFHPRTDAATDFACEAGKRNVYFISEFASGEFAVGGWLETTGGNA